MRIGLGAGLCSYQPSNIHTLAGHARLILADSGTIVDANGETFNFVDELGNKWSDGAGNHFDTGEGP